MNNEKLGTLAALISGISYGIYPILAKITYHSGANVPTVLFFRFLGTALIIWLYLYIKERSAGCLPYIVTIKLLLIGFFLYAGMSGFYLLSFTKIPSSLSCMLLYFYPAMVTVYTVFMKQEIYTWQKGIALFIATTGLFLLLQASFAIINIPGILYGIGAGLLYAVYVILGTNIIKSVEPIKATFCIMTGSAFSYGLIGLGSGMLIVKLQAITWVLLCCIVLFSTVFGIACFWVSIKFIGPVKASIISTIEPMVTTLLSTMVFQDKLTILQLFGGIMIIAAVFVLRYSDLEYKKASIKIED